MVLELRPNCELCDVDLPPASESARICTYECTFCADCVDGVLQNEPDEPRTMTPHVDRSTSGVIVQSFDPRRE